MFPLEVEGSIQLQLAGTNNIEVITRRPPMRYLYDLHGSLVSEHSYAPKAFADFPGSAEGTRVPTPWWLWMFTSLMHPWVLMVFGLLLLLFAKRGPRNERAA